VTAGTQAGAGVIRSAGPAPWLTGSSALRPAGPSHRPTAK